MALRCVRPFAAMRDRAGRAIKEGKDLLLSGVSLLSRLLDGLEDLLARAPLAHDQGVIRRQWFATLFDDLGKLGHTSHPWTERLRKQIATRPHRMEPFEQRCSPGIGKASHERTDESPIELLVRFGDLANPFECLV